MISKLLSKVQTFVIGNFLLVGFGGAVIFAFTYPFGGKLLYSWKTGEFRIIELINNFFVFFISGLTLKLEDLKSISKHKLAVVYSLVTINFITTLFAFGTINLPYLDQTFAIGMTIFASVPTTLGVGVALTQLAKGDHILSLFLTVVSNLLGIVTVPFLLRIYLSGSSAIQIDPLKLAFKMTITVLVPTVLGMVTRHLVAAVPAFTKTYRTHLSLTSTFNLVMIVWMAMSSARNSLLVQNVGDLFYVLGVVCAMHIFYLCANALMVSKYVLNLNRKQAVSVIIMASQKSSPVALAVITSLATDNTQQKGLFALPCIIGQLSQIFIGSFIVGRLALWIEQEQVQGQEQQQEMERSEGVVVDDSMAVGEELCVSTEELLENAGAGQTGAVLTVDCGDLQEGPA